MPAAKDILDQDPNLKVICNEIAEHVPVESIILCGSRATKQGVTENSDYDMPVVMKTYMIPFYLSKLKKVERELNQKLGVNIAINPLPTFRVKRAKGNLFLFKVKREGITLYGRDYIRELNPGEIRDIPADRYFSFLFSAAKDLVQNFDPEFLREKPCDEDSKKILCDAAKAIIYCAELRLLLKGYYETESAGLILKLSKFESDDFIEDIKAAVDIKNGNRDSVRDPLEFWFKATAYIIETFRKLMQNFIDTKNGDVEVLIQDYLGRKNKFFFKTFEYFALTSIIKRDVYWRTFFTKTSIEDKMRICLLYLLLSIRENGTIDKDKLDKAYDILKGFITIPYINVKPWKNIKESMINYWPYACTVIGV